MTNLNYSGDFGHLLSSLLDEHATDPADTFEYLNKWAVNAGLTLDQLVVEILSAACDGDQFVKGRPRSGE